MISEVVLPPCPEPPIEMLSEMAVAKDSTLPLVSAFSEISPAVEVTMLLPMYASTLLLMVFSLSVTLVESPTPMLMTKLMAGTSALILESSVALMSILRAAVTAARLSM